MSVELNNDFFPDLRNIAMERLLQIIPNNAKVVVNTPCNTRFRKNPSSERKKKIFTLDFRNVTLAGADSIGDSDASAASSGCQLELMHYVQ